MYKGDITPPEAHERLKKNANAVLIDVRTQPEWTFVGVPQVDRLVRLSWQVYPQMEVNARFVEEVEADEAAARTPRSCASAAPARARPRPLRR
jgi:rhodanese-related sulfurtransferase